MARPTRRVARLDHRHPPGRDAKRRQVGSHPSDLAGNIGRHKVPHLIHPRCPLAGPHTTRHLIRATGMARNLELQKASILKPIRCCRCGDVPAGLRASHLVRGGRVRRICRESCGAPSPQPGSLGEGALGRSTRPRSHGSATLRFRGERSLMCPYAGGSPDQIRPTGRDSDR